MENSLYIKYQKLQSILLEAGSVAVAFSGGVDSTFLLSVAHGVLGERVLAVTAKSCLFPERELDEAGEFCAENGIRQVIFELEALDIKGFRQNPKNRCYVCKHKIFEKIREIAREEGLHVVAEGSNMDDMGDYRPGLAAVRELGIKSPLQDAELHKAEIRELSKELSLSTWNKQSFACLSSRFVYGETISEEKLSMVDKAEQMLLDMDFHQVRVRIHDRLARIEVAPDEFDRISVKDIRETLCRELKALGFSYVTLDLMGYRTGSMNETL
ncbi:MAG: ATP-dependent sacrificial sulfur transferase LarE [Lachnospiraceae bacterium]|nr:ATP-dependent sacrificial sulfur transferase LarE [Lachnospiraceae bacterium]